MFKTAYGSSSLAPEWIQLANLTEKPIFIKKGENVGLLHPREQPKVNTAVGLDVQKEDLKREREISLATAEAKRVMEQKGRDFLQEAFIRLVKPTQDCMQEEKNGSIQKDLVPLV